MMVNIDINNIDNSFIRCNVTTVYWNWKSSNRHKSYLIAIYALLDIC